MKKEHKKQAVVAIIQQHDQFLLVKRSEHTGQAQGYWCPVSGHIEANETQAEAVQREVMEEVGLQVVAEEKICDIPSRDQQYTLHFWTTKIISGEAKITSHEASALKWVTLDEMKALAPVFEEDIQIFQTLI